ncbi:MAG: hypothetical protein ACYTF9_02185, partial [Planctomycetota bacterium]
HAVLTLSRRPALLVAVLATVVLGPATLQAQHPTPASVPYRWELNFKPGALRLYVDDEDGKAYWFMTYKVENRTGRDQVWAPRFTLFTDDGRIMQSGRDVATRVTADLLAILGNELMEDQNTIIGDLLHGREHAKDGLVIWPARNLNVNRLSLFVAGISGESLKIKNPATGEDVILRKTLQRDYLVRGDAGPRGSQELELATQRWIMR